MPPAGGRSQRPRTSGRPRALWLVVLGCLALLVLVPVLYTSLHRSVIYPGVRVAGIHLGRRDAADALARLADAGLDPQAPVTLRAGDESWTLQPGESGLAFDAAATVRQAWGVGREGGRLRGVWDAFGARFGGREVAPIVLVDRDRLREALATLAAVHDQPARNASIAFNGTEVAPLPAEPGRAIDLEAARAALEAAAAAGTWPLNAVELPVVETPPEVTDAGPALASAQAILAQPVTFSFGEQSWVLDPAALAPMLTTRHAGEAVALDIDRAGLAAWLNPVTESISRTAQVPRFHFDDATKALVLQSPGLPGERVDVDATAERMLDAADRGSPRVALAVERVPPSIADDVQAADLGIRELLREETSRFTGSAPGRIHNVALAASKFDGLLIPPDAVFSFNENIGEITEEEGYKETLIIMDGATADGIGGGVCQVSTTLFRTAFWTGLPIVERSAHGYRVAYYEQGSPTGFDATVYRPVVDLKIKNDTGAWILIETNTDTRRATTTFRFYGSKPAREVAMEGPVVGRTVPPPPPRTELDPSLAPGQTELVENARSGASVSLTRVIRTPEGEQRETFYSNYRPTGQVTAVGPAAPAPAGPPADPGQAAAPGDTAAAQTAQNPAAIPGAAPPP